MTHKDFKTERRQKNNGVCDYGGVDKALREDQSLNNHAWEDKGQDEILEELVDTSNMPRVRVAKALSTGHDKATTHVR